MSIHFGVDEKGYVNEQLIRYMAARAEGGVGMMLVGGGGVHPSGVELPHLPALWEDDCIPGLKTMTAAVKPHDTLIGMQLMHGGRQSYHERKVAPSAIPAPALAKGTPRELRLDEIPIMVAAFGDAARRCQEAGIRTGSSFPPPTRSNLSDVIVHGPRVPATHKNALILSGGRCVAAPRGGQIEFFADVDAATHDAMTIALHQLRRRQPVVAAPSRVPVEEKSRDIRRLWAQF